MRLVILSFILILCRPCFSQVKTYDKLIGKWEVFSAQISEDVDLEEDELKKMESVKDGFVNTIFTFNSDKSFQVLFSNKTPPFMQELEFLNNKKWKFDSKEGLISIGTEEDKYSLMGIFVINQEDQTFFIFDESPFLLRVVKL